MQPTTLDAYNLMHEGTIAFSHAEQNGMRIDVDYCNKKKKHIDRKIARAQEKLNSSDLIKDWKKQFGEKTNFNSGQQLAHMLYKIKGIKPPKMTGGGKKDPDAVQTGSTDNESLITIAKDIPELMYILDIKKLQKIRDTYLDAFLREQVNGYIHPFLNLHTVRTYRSSSNSPNLQNIPKRDKEAMKICRRAIFPRPGHQLIEIDFGALEVSIAACVTGDTLLETSTGSRTILDIINSVNNGEQTYVYGYNQEEERIVLAPVTSGGITRRNTGVWGVTLDNGQVIRATEDHQFLTRKEGYKKLADLEIGESLMPFYKRKRVSNYGTVYREIYLNNGTRQLEHNITLEEYKATYNHKVVKIEFMGWENVYNINVEGIHNYATSAGVVLKNCYHKDKNMLKYLTSDHADMHGDVAAQIFLVDGYDKSKYPGHKLIRNATKNSFIFPQFYGDYYGNNTDGLCTWCQLPHTKWRKGYGVDFVEGMTVGDHLISKGITSYDKFKQHLKNIEEDFWGVRFREYGAWKLKWHAKYQRDGYFNTLTGFKCQGVMGKNEVINYPVQGSAFHCLLWSFITINKIAAEENWDSRIVNQIHDAVIIDTHPDELEHVARTVVEVTCKKLAEHWDWIIVPLTVDADICDVDAPWSEKKHFPLPEI